MAGRFQRFRTTGKILIALGAVTLAPMLVAAGLSSSASTGVQAYAEETPSSSTELGEVTREALRAALEDERRSKATYRAVIDHHGEVLPFARIVEAEGRHEAHLLALFESYGLAIPEDSWKDKAVEVPATLVEACRQGAESEKVNVALYDEILAADTIAQTDIRELFGHLRDMSRDHHLQAFTRCVERGGAPSGMGPGPRQGKARGGCSGMHRGMDRGRAPEAGPPAARSEEAGRSCGRGRCGAGETCGCGRCRQGTP